MPVKIEITGQVAAEALSELTDLAAALVPTTSASPCPHPHVPNAVTVAALREAEMQTATEVVIHQQANEPAPAKRTRKPKTAEATPSIQAKPENRVDPATEAQDTADEKAEQAPAQGRPLSGDDVRAAMTDYLKKYGKVAAMEDGPKILGVAKISELGDDQEKLRKAVEDTASAVANNPFKRAVEAA